MHWDSLCSWGRQRMLKVHSYQEETSDSEKLWSVVYTGACLGALCWIKTSSSTVRKGFKRLKAAWNAEHVASVDALGVALTFVNQPHRFLGHAGSRGVTKTIHMGQSRRLPPLQIADPFLKRHSVWCCCSPLNWPGWGQGCAAFVTWELMLPWFCTWCLGKWPLGRSAEQGETQHELWWRTKMQVEGAILEVNTSVWYANTWLGIKRYQSTLKLAMAVQQRGYWWRSCHQWSQWKHIHRLQHKVCTAIHTLTKCRSGVFVKK